MKSIIFLLFILLISIFAYINQDAVVDVLLGLESNSKSTSQTQEIRELEEEVILESENGNSENTDFLKFQNSRSLDDDFTQKDPMLEINDSSDLGGQTFENNSQTIDEILGFKNFESKLLKLTYYQEYEFSEITSELIDIKRQGNKVGEITIVQNVEDSNIETYFENQDFNFISDADKQGVYPENFEQAFFDESLKFLNFSGLKSFDYFILKKNSKIVILKIESAQKDKNFEKVILSSLRLK